MRGLGLRAGERAKLGSERGGPEFTLTPAPQGLGSSTIGPGGPLMGTTHPGPKGGRALHQDEKYKLSGFRAASGLLGYWGNGPNPNVEPASDRFRHPVGSTDPTSFAPCAAPRALRGLGS